MDEGDLSICTHHPPLAAAGDGRRHFDCCFRADRLGDARCRRGFVFSCFFAALFGAFNYLCPPSQVFLTRGFVDLGMGQGLALAFIITGPAVSLPSVVILGKIVGWKKAFTYIGLLLGDGPRLMGYYGIVR